MVRVELVVTSSLWWRSIFNICDASCEKVFGQELVSLCSFSFCAKISFCTLSRGLPLKKEVTNLCQLYIFLMVAISNVKICSPNASSWNSVIKVASRCGDAGGGGGLDVGGEGEIASQVSPLISRWMVRIPGSGHQEQLDHHRSRLQHNINKQLEMQKWWPILIQFHTLVSVCHHWRHFILLESAM